MKSAAYYEIDYAQLVHDYYKNLNETLRNFRGGPDFLETWGYDDNHNRSLVEIFDLAVSHNVPNLRIRLSRDVADALDLDVIRSDIQAMGQIELTPGATASESILLFHAGPSEVVAKANAEVSEVYRENILKACQSLSHERTKTILNKGPVLASERDGMKLHLTLDSKGIVLSALHEGAAGMYRGLLDRLCAILESRPMQEGAEHAVVRLENDLRDETKVPKGRGIIVPSNADPVFVVCQHLVRDAFRQYSNTTSIELPRNEWRDPIPEAWLSKSILERQQLLERELGALSNNRDLGVTFKVIEILNDTRVVLSAEIKSLKGKDYAAALIPLERALREKFNVEIELQMESIEDRNKRQSRTEPAFLAKINNKQDATI